jgi:hypothetical protein
MATLTFDKLAYVDRLKAAGIDEGQARALADGLDQALREEVATKTDIAAIRMEMVALRHELKGDIAALRHELKGDIGSARHDLLRWMVGMGFAQVGLQVGLTVVLTRFLPH